MLAVKLLSQFRWWAVTLSRWPCLLPVLVLQLEVDVKEPATLFKKIRGRRPRCLSDLCRHWSGWARCDQNMNWSGCKSAPLYADVRSRLSGSSAIQPLAASEESWHRIFFFNPNHYFKCLTLISIVASARNRSDNIRNSRLCKLHKVSKGGLGRWDQTLGNRLRTAKESPWYSSHLHAI